MTATLVDTTATAVAGADGTATVRFYGPGVSQDVLHVDAIACTSTSTALPNVTLYRGESAAGRRIAYNPDGRSGTFRGGGSADRIGAGDVWSCVWAACTVGASCSASLTGTVSRRGA